MARTRREAERLEDLLAVEHWEGLSSRARRSARRCSSRCWSGGTACRGVAGFTANRAAVASSLARNSGSFTRASMVLPAEADRVTSLSSMRPLVSVRSSSKLISLPYGSSPGSQCVTVSARFSLPSPASCIVHARSQVLLLLWMRRRASGRIGSPVLTFAMPAEPIHVPLGPLRYAVAPGARRCGPVTSASKICCAREVAGADTIRSIRTPAPTSPRLCWRSNWVWGRSSWPPMWRPSTTHTARGKSERSPARPRPAFARVNSRRARWGRRSRRFAGSWSARAAAA